MHVAQRHHGSPRSGHGVAARRVSSLLVIRIHAANNRFADDDATLERKLAELASLLGQRAPKRKDDLAICPQQRVAQTLDG
jgi:hypothetical protein